VPAPARMGCSRSACATVGRGALTALSVAPQELMHLYEAPAMQAASGAVQRMHGMAQRVLGANDGARWCLQLTLCGCCLVARLAKGGGGGLGARESCRSAV